jgi:glycerophosphoryl diester phosphodiesterase/predicted MFS family arabinose efflux permease
MEKAPASVWKSAGFGALLLLAFINLFNYLDRYILVALAPAIKRDLGLSDLQVGLLATAFMGSYLLISPVFGWLGDTKPRYRLMATGVALWSVATALTGRAAAFGSMMLARFGVGVGEAAYGSISPAVISDLFPVTQRGRAFSVFFVAIPVGSALGYLLAGLLEKSVGWRHAFLIAGLPGVLLALALLFAREPRRGAFDEDGCEESRSLGGVLSSLFRNSNYVLTVLGYCAYTFVLGGVAVWIPHYVERYLGMPAADGNMAFGAVTVITGILATFIGGAWADRWALRGTDAYLKLSALSMFLAVPVFVGVLLAPGFWSFFALVFALEFLLFLSTSPVSAQIVNCVPPSMRAMANAASIFLIHLLGDMISPPLVGFVSDHSSLWLGMWVFLAGILLSGAIWAAKVVIFWEALPWPQGAFALPRAQCHRGYRAGGAVENTLEAFRAAAKAGAKMVELDAHVSADGVAVVIHDGTIDRTAGRAGVVAEMKAADLRALANAPSLLEVLADPACAGLFVNVELKSGSARDTGLEAAVAEAVRGAGAEGRVLFSSFNPFALRRISRLFPGCPRALLATGEAEDGNKFYLRKTLLAFLARPHMLNYDQRSLSPARAASFRARKVPFAVWTVNDPAEARKCLAMGAESIISDLPDIL